MFYQPKHFTVPELIPPNLYAARGDAAIIVMDERILITLNRLREIFNVPITVNNWKDGGPFQQRGFRNDPGTGALLSQHRYGRAADFDIQGLTAAAVRQMVKDGKLGAPGKVGSPMEFITRLEETNNGVPITWNHADCGLQIMQASVYSGIQFIQA